METTPTLIHARWIITCDTQNQVLENHCLVMQADKIKAILPSKTAKDTYPNAPEQHYADHALLPGFINCHTHLAMNVFRGLADDLPLMTWLQHHIWPAEAEWVSAEMVRDGSLLAMAEMIRCGTTYFNDMFFYPEETAKAAELAGLRGHVAMHIMLIPNNWAKSIEECFEKSLVFYEQYKNHPTITPILSPQSAYTVPQNVLADIKALAEKLELRINIHCQESVGDVEGAIKLNNKRPLRCLTEVGLVNSNLITMHMTQLDDKDIETLSIHKPHIVHCPESNMKLASGICPVSQLLKLGVNVALGTDGAASNNDLDMIGEMRSAAFLAKVATLDPTALSAEQVLRMATINGAKALGIDHFTGSLEAGKSADFITINLEQIETQPLFHPVPQIVYAATRDQVTDVWVAGKQLLKNRKLTTLNEVELLKKAKIWQQRLTNQRLKVSANG